MEGAVGGLKAMLFANSQLFAAALLNAGPVLFPGQLALCQGFLRLPRSCLQALAPQPLRRQIPKQESRTWKMLGPCTALEKWQRGHGVGTAQMPTPPCAGQMQDGKQKPHQSGRLPGWSGRRPGKRTAW